MYEPFKIDVCQEVLYLGNHQTKAKPTRTINLLPLSDKPDHPPEGTRAIHTV
jgi:hypothetical protein